VSRYQDVLATFGRTHEPAATPEQTELTPEQLEALRALGYIDSE
jgi:hypothetical protein